ncbi:MAG: DUF1440 domain-containing protein [Actinomycetota bacterium]|nr:DUF1440 domain-containing protein [Actinomycetota bacterium]
MARTSPLGALARGLAAGVAGTAAMTAAQELSIKLMGSGEQPQPPDAGPSDPWEAASTPAKVARRVIEGVFDREVSADSIPLLTHAMHWGYGIGWGAVYGLIEGTSPGPALRRGPLFGTAVWGLSYAELVPMGLYEPPWKYGVKDLALEVGYHLVYGTGVAAAYAAIERA